MAAVGLEQGVVDAFEYKTVLDNLIHQSLGVLGVPVGFFLGPGPGAQS